MAIVGAARSARRCHRSRWVLDALSGDWDGAVGGLHLAAFHRPARGSGSRHRGARYCHCWFAARRVGESQPRETVGGRVAPGGGGQHQRRRKWPCATPRCLWLPCSFAGSVLLAFFRRARPWRSSAPGRCSCSRESGHCSVAGGSSASGPLSGAWHCVVRGMPRGTPVAVWRSGLLAAGVFMISSMAAFQLDARGARGDAGPAPAALPLSANQLPRSTMILTQPAGGPSGWTRMRPVSRLCRPGRGTATGELFELPTPAEPAGAWSLLPRVSSSAGRFPFGGADDCCVLDAWEGTGPVPAGWMGITSGIRSRPNSVMCFPFAMTGRPAVAYRRAARSVRPSRHRHLSDGIRETVSPIRWLPLFSHRCAAGRGAADASHPTAGEPRPRPDPGRGAARTKSTPFRIPISTFSARSVNWIGSFHGRPRTAAGAQRA